MQIPAPASAPSACGPTTATRATSINASSTNPTFSTCVIISRNRASRRGAHRAPRGVLITWEPLAPGLCGRDSTTSSPLIHSYTYAPFLSDRARTLGLPAMGRMAAGGVRVAWDAGGEVGCRYEGGDPGGLKSP